MMKENDYIDMIVSEEWSAITIRFRNEAPKILAIGERLNQLNKYAYMNGYNWAVLIEYILKKESPDWITGLESMPEGGSYYMRYDLNEENLTTCKMILERIKLLIEDETALQEVVKKEGDLIEWD